MLNTLRPIPFLILMLTSSALLAGCGSVFLYPSDNFAPLPERIHDRYEQITLSAPGEPTVIVWRFPVEKPLARVLFFHGNAGNLSTHAGVAVWFAQHGFEVYALDYRGFGGSEGSASVEGAIKDSRRLLSYVQERHAGEVPLLLFGQSFGGTVALRLACDHRVREHTAATIADSPFASYELILREKLQSLWLTYPFAYPLSALLAPDVDPLPCLSKLSTYPIVLLRTLKDKTVEPHHSDIIFAALQTERFLLESEIGGHIQALHNPEVASKFFGIITDILEQHAAKQ